MKELTSRFAVPADWPRLKELHHEQSQKWQTDYELPYLFGSAERFPVVIVAVDDAGQIQEAFYVERTAELRFVGSNPTATAHLQRDAAGLSYLLRALGYRWLECFVPKRKIKGQKLVEMIAKPLRRAGFEGTSRKLAHFTLDMRGDANEQGRSQDSV